ncbi:VaFE repeat-containing surface-anchored protein, partial [Corynebacterium diphtheriae]|uniref:VaFE repeat-containing surface-anchored protein n=1 Tax=Corynebacterium diphtheriae TaxID=1717 RepID=UPI00217D957B
MNRTIPNERDTFSGPYDPNNLQTGHGLRYAKNYGESLLPFADNPRKDANQGVLNAMLNGYPKNAAGLQAALKLTDNEMRYATQLAVWYWADSDYGRHITDATENSQEIKKAFKILTGQETSPVQLKKVDPATATLEIYSVSQPTGPSFNYQNLLSAKFVNPLDGNPIKEGDRPVPDLKTTATDQKDGDKVIAAEGGKVKDVVTYSGLTVGTEYVVSGELMEKGSDDKAVGTGIKASKKFTAQAASGTVDVVFDVPSGYAGKKLVAFETLTMSADGKFVAEHKDISDEDQTVTVAEGDRPGPDLKTTATDQKDGDKVIAAEGGKVKDVVTYSG